MRKLSTPFLLSFLLSCTTGRSQHTISAYLTMQYNETIHDITLGNNPWGIGSGLQILVNNKTKFKPIVALTEDTYFQDDKVQRSDPQGKPLATVREMINIFIGSSFFVGQDAFFALVAGPDFINSQTYLGVSPSFGFYFSNKHKVMGKISYINIFNREKETKEDFTSISFALGLKLF